MAVDLPTAESELRHIFRDAEGHVQDTPENRKLLLEIANDESSRLTEDRYENVWSATTLPDGKQVWTQVRSGKIINGGIDTVPRTLNPETGLKRP